MNVVLYCQHVLGLGHFMRSLALLEAMAPHRCVFVAGGPDAPVALPGHITLERLPAISMDETFSRLLAGDDPEALKAARRTRLLDILERERPDVLLVELYPFGRRAFEFELLPALEAARAGAFGRPRVLCSLRDILVEKTDPEKYQTRVIARLNALFDGLLVHSDPSLFPLEETFPRAREIAVPLHYTGFVTPRPDPLSRRRVRGELGLAGTDRLVVASAGGGKVGSELLFAALDAHPFLQHDNPPRLELFSGPFLDDAAFERLRAVASGRERRRVSRFSGDFLGLLAASDASLSLAGYNTTMNILAAGARALVWPFEQNREQRLRAERLAARGLLGVLEHGDLHPARLAERVHALLESPAPDPRAAPDLDGARNTARIVTRDTAQAG
ncbi:hypothetical protein NNJEOMEG_01125 [Fundidesulfovibrio magnetotacticus]|uniref:Glycosyl transferase family 28 C-terminal domain-containing protein n=1 Tax=Fundidesulfovibrio magnetotacticus TaxID=2730080 RepID=A0A6V8LNN2_9BACT|nr:glycosyltransferase [Fundidesulfovibrio magnetotacticus]GFK93294.1 hypothetical protein NNJEOMEG_01125 [Fundidesulfovibrio magnetotacticus]